MNVPELSGIPAVILCGGLGTRLHSTIGRTPKVLAPIAGQPFIDIGTAESYERAQRVLPEMLRGALV